MSEQDKIKWNLKYKEKVHKEESRVQCKTNPVLVQLSSYLSGGHALDIACGLGGNSFFLVKKGYRVQAIDVSEVAVDFVQKRALEENLNIDAICADLDEFIFPAGEYDLIVDTYYLNRSLISLIQGAVKPGGLFFMETFCQTNPDPNTQMKKEYKLKPGELKQIFAGWEILFYREDEGLGIVSMLARRIK